MVPGIIYPGLADLPLHAYRSRAHVPGLTDHLSGLKPAGRWWLTQLSPVKELDVVSFASHEADTVPAPGGGPGNPGSREQGPCEADADGGHPAVILRYLAPGRPAKPLPWRHQRPSTAGRRRRPGRRTRGRG